MADTEIVVQAQSTAFQRSGSSFHRKGYVFPSEIGGLLASAYYSTTPGTGISAVERALLQVLMAQDPTVIPGGLTLKNIQSIFPSAFNGAADLQLLYQKDPFSTEFELSTKTLYERQYDKARVVVQSGPTNVRGATARQAFELAALDTEMANNRFREIWQAQVAIAQLVIAAVQTAAQAETERWRLQLQAQQQQAATEQGRVVQGLSASENLSRVREANIRAIAAGVEFFGQSQMGIEEDLIGEGVQNSAQTNFGMSYWR